MKIVRASAVLLAAAFGAAAVAAAVEGPGRSDDAEDAERLTTVTGTLQVEGKEVRLGARRVGLGPPWYRETAKAADYDGDGTVETIAKELEGLDGRSVSVTGEADGDEVGARTIAGKPYREAGRPPWAGGGKNRAAKCARFEAKAKAKAAKAQAQGKAGRGGGPPPWAKAYGRRGCS